MTTIAKSVHAIAQGSGWPERAAIAATVRFQTERQAREVCGIKASATIREEHLCVLLYDTTLSQQQLVAEIRALVAKSPVAIFNAAGRVAYARRRREIAGC